MHGYTRFFESWICVETGQLDRAAVAAADSLGLAEQHGFDLFQLVGATQHATLSALAALDADHDARRLAPHIATLTTLLDTWRTLEVNAYITFYDAILGRLLIATGQPEQARHRLNTGLQLAEDIGMCFYDAELLRLRAHAHTDPDARQAEIAAAFELAHHQGATLFELRAALDDFDLRGQPACAALADAAGRVPANSPLPELARARAILDQVAYGFE